MLMVVSPAKSLDFESPLPSGLPATRPPMLDESARLADILRQMAPQDIAGLMQVSDKIAALNVARFAEWHANYSAPQARQAVFAFNGDVYEGLDAASLDRAGLDWLQPRLNILSGLDRPTGGRARVAGEDLSTMNSRQRTDFRRNAVGFVFQQTSRNLLPFLTAHENVTMPMVISSRKGRTERATQLLELLGVGDIADRLPAASLAQVTLDCRQ
mgnify:CR=1 FL=1